jgi:hypothetical protein
MTIDEGFPESASPTEEVGIIATIHDVTDDSTLSFDQDNELFIKLVNINNTDQETRISSYEDKYDVFNSVLDDAFNILYTTMYTSDEELLIGPVYDIDKVNTLTAEFGELLDQVPTNYFDDATCDITVLYA